MIRTLLLISCLLGLYGSETQDAYAWWSQGRPQEALPVLTEKAETEQRWDLWYDASLAAHDCQQHGLAVAYMLRAWRLAPAEPRVQEGLQFLNVTIPDTWTARLGPLARISTGFIGLIGLIIGMLLIGYAIAGQKRRRSAILCGALISSFFMPGLAAHILDSMNKSLVIVRPTQLLDSVGNTLGQIPEGTIVTQAHDTPWSGRQLVRLANGQKGFIPLTDLDMPHEYNNTSTP